MNGLIGLARGVVEANEAILVRDDDQRVLMHGLDALHLLWWTPQSQGGRNLDRGRLLGQRPAGRLRVRCAVDPGLGEGRRLGIAVPLPQLRGSVGCDADELIRGQMLDAPDGVALRLDRAEQDRVVHGVVRRMRRRRIPPQADRRVERAGKDHAACVGAKPSRDRKGGDWSSVTAQRRNRFKLLAATEDGMS